jgi:hypothetical protein
LVLHQNSPESSSVQIQLVQFPESDSIHLVYNSPNSIIRLARKIKFTWTLGIMEEWNSRFKDLKDSRFQFIRFTELEIRKLTARVGVEIKNIFPRNDTRYQ